MWKIARLIAILAVLGAVGAFLFAASGLYNVAASTGHIRITEWFLEFGMRRSVAHHSRGIEPPPLDDVMAERAAGHFHSGCAPCHGAPGLAPSPVTRGMLPHAPDLSRAVPTWRLRELFFIVRHGLKYTGMPAWPADQRDDEVWAMVAFLQRLPDMSPEVYRRLTGTMRAVPETDPAADLPEAIQCARCHGARGEGRGGVPRLAGQRTDYLLTALEDYASGERPSGMMHPVALFLDDAHRRALASHYAALRASPSPASSVEAARLGERLARDGAAERGIPPCASCHGADGRAEENHPRYPALAGQHAAYLEQQLRLWRAGTRGGTFADIMAVAARELTDEEIRALAAYYAGLPARE